MNLISDIITYIRRIIKSPSNATITDDLIIDYLNRFYLNDVDARMQLFDLKTKYQFQTKPAVDQYNMPLYDLQIEQGSQTIGMYPVYQGFLSPAYINGVQVALETLKTPFFNSWPNVVQNLQAIVLGNGTVGPYAIQLPILGVNSPVTPMNPPLQGILRGHVDISGIIATGVNQDPPFGTSLHVNGSGNFDIPQSSMLAQVFLTSLDVNGNSIVVQDSGQFLSIDGTKYANLGLLMVPGNNPFGYSAMPGGYANSFAITGITQANPAVLTSTTNFIVGQSITINGVSGMTELNGNTYTVTAVSGTTVTIDVDSTLFMPYTLGGTASSIINVVNYLTGEMTVVFPTAIPQGQNINVQVFYFQTGLPLGILYYNNTLTFRSPPDKQYLVELDAYLTPSAFLSSSAAVPFAYMSEYIARGAARKILSDTGDVEQFQFYEPLFREQEMLVWKRSQRQWTNNRTPTIYSMGSGNYGNGNNNIGGGSI